MHQRLENMKYDLSPVLAVDPSFIDIPKQTPEFKLLFAMLDRGIRDYLETTVGEFSKHNRNNATRWIFGKESYNNPAPFSFEWTCTELELSFTDLRVILKEAARDPQAFLSIPAFRVNAYSHSRNGGGRYGAKSHSLKAA